jgi:hypothetical protein
VAVYAFLVPVVALAVALAVAEIVTAGVVRHAVWDFARQCQ